MNSPRRDGSVWRQIYYSQALWGVAGHPGTFGRICLSVTGTRRGTPTSPCAKRPRKRAFTQNTALARCASKLKKEKRRKKPTNFQTGDAHPDGPGVSMLVPGATESRSLFHSSSIVSVINTNIDFEVWHQSGQIRVRGAVVCLQAATDKSNSLVVLVNYACIYLCFGVAAVEKVRSYTCDFFDSGPLIQHFFVHKSKTQKRQFQSRLWLVIYRSDPFLIYRFSIFALDIWLLILYVEALVKYSLCTDNNCMF